MGFPAATIVHTAEAPHYALVIAWTTPRPIGGSGGNQMGLVCAAREKSAAMTIAAMMPRAGNAVEATGGVPACALCC